MGIIIAYAGVAAMFGATTLHMIRDARASRVRAARGDRR